MTRAALEHLLRAASAITNEREFVVIGSQAVRPVAVMAATVHRACVDRAAQGYGSVIFTPLASNSSSMMRCHDAVLVLRP